jgi:hypothetical protein
VQADDPEPSGDGHGINERTQATDDVQEDNTMQNVSSVEDEIKRRITPTWCDMNQRT